jgi:SAM-dependent methyltransferase
LQAVGFSNVTGIDLSEDAIQRCHAGGLVKTAVMDATNPQYADRSFDLLIASDVLEHISDEGSALRNWLRILKPGGQLLVCVPAFTFLWSHHDTVNHHQRRYTSKRLRSALERAGFSVDRASYWNLSLFLPVAGVRLAQRAVSPEARGAGQLHASSPLVNSILYALLRAENHLLFSSLPFPFGVSVFAIARRPASIA